MTLGYGLLCLQGDSRKQRGLIFFEYLTLKYPQAIQTQSVAIVPGCGHDAICMFQSDKFRQAWLGK